MMLTQDPHGGTPAVVVSHHDQGHVVVMGEPDEQVQQHGGKPSRTRAVVWGKDLGPLEYTIFEYVISRFSRDYTVLFKHGEKTRIFKEMAEKMANRIAFVKYSGVSKKGLLDRFNTLLARNYDTLQHDERATREHLTWENENQDKLKAMSSYQAIRLTRDEIEIELERLRRAKQEVESKRSGEKAAKKREAMPTEDDRLATKRKHDMFLPALSKRGKSNSSGSVAEEQADGVDMDELGLGSAKSAMASMKDSLLPSIDNQGTLSIRNAIASMKDAIIQSTDSQVQAIEQMANSMSNGSQISEETAKNLAAELSRCSSLMETLNKQISNLSSSINQLSNRGGL